MQVCDATPQAGCAGRCKAHAGMPMPAATPQQPQRASRRIAERRTRAPLGAACESATAASPVPPPDTEMAASTSAGAASAVNALDHPAALFGREAAAVDGTAVDEVGTVLEEPLVRPTCALEHHGDNPVETGDDDAATDGGARPRLATKEVRSQTAFHLQTHIGVGNKAP